MSKLRTKARSLRLLGLLSVSRPMFVKSKCKHEKCVGFNKDVKSFQSGNTFQCVQGGVQSMGLQVGDAWSKFCQINLSEYDKMIG